MWDVGGVADENGEDNDDDEDLEHHLHDEEELDDHPHGGSEEEDVMDGANVVEVAEMDEDEDAAAAAAFNAMQDDMDGDMGLGMEEADGAGEEDGHEEGEDEDEDEDEEVDEEGSEEEYDHEEDGDMVRMRNLNIDPRLLPLLDHHRQGVGAAGRLWDMELDDRHGFGADLAGGAQAVPTLSQMLGEAVNMFDRQHGRRLSRTLATNQSSPIQLMSSLMSTQHRMLARPAAPRDGAAIGAGAGSAASQANAVSSLMTLASRYNPADFDGAGLGDGEVAEFRNLLRAGPPGDAVRAAGLHFLNMPSTVAGRPILRLDTNGGPISLMGGPEGRTAAGLMSAATGASLAAGSGDSSHIDTRMLETQLLSVLRADAASAAAAAGVTLPTTAASAHQTAADAATLAAMQVNATMYLMTPPATIPAAGASAAAASTASASTPVALPGQSALPQLTCLTQFHCVFLSLSQVDATVYLMTPPATTPAAGASATAASAAASIASASILYRPPRPACLTSPNLAYSISQSVLVPIPGGCNCVSYDPSSYHPCCWCQCHCCIHSLGLYPLSPSPASLPYLTQLALLNFAVDATVSLMAPPATTPAGAGAAASAPASTPAATPAPTPPPSAPAAGGPASTTAPGLISPNLFGEALVAASAAAARSVGVRTHAADLARALATGLQAARDAAETAGAGTAATTTPAPTLPAPVATPAPPGAGTAAPTTPAPTLPTPVVTPAPLAPPAPEADPSNAPMVDTATGEAAAAAASDRQPEPMEVEEEEPRAVAEPMATEPPPASASTLDERLRTAAVNAGIDLAFLEALPDDLRAEVLSMHGAAASSAAAPPPTLPGPPPTGGAAAPLVSAAPPASGAATPAEGSAPPAAAATAPPATAAEPVAQTGAAGSAGQAAAAAPESAADEDGGPEEGGLDPEFLAALPPDIQQELLAQQRLEQRRREAQRQRRVVERSQAAATAATAAAASASAAAAPAVPGTAAAGAEAGATGEAGTAVPISRRQLLLALRLEPQVMQALQQTLPPCAEIVILTTMPTSRRQLVLKLRLEPQSGPSTGRYPHQPFPNLYTNPSYKNGMTNASTNPNLNPTAGVGDAAAPARAPGELDLASLLATFPPDVLRSRFQREATLSDDFMASLGMAGPSMPRMSLFGGRPPPEADLRAAFSNTLRRFAPGGPGNPTGGVPVGQRVHRTTGPGPGGTHPGSRALVATASASGAVMGAEMRLQDSSAAAALDSTSPPLMSQDDLMSLVGLLRVSQPATKAPLQRVLLNLCCHAATRRSLLRNMLAMVGPDVAEEDDKQPDVSDMATDTPPTAAAPSSAVPPTSSAVPIDLDVLGTAPEEASPQEELDMRAGVQPDQTSAPQVQRRMLEMVTFLSKHSKQVARMLLLLNIPLSPATTSAELAAAAASAAEQARKGKAPVNAAKPAAEDEDERKALELLLSSLGHPLCKRSTTTMEMVLLLLELILKAGSAYADELKAHVDAFEQVMT
eukprot:gene16843-23123_t